MKGTLSDPTIIPKECMKAWQRGWQTASKLKGTTLKVKGSSLT